MAVRGESLGVSRTVEIVLFDVLPAILKAASPEEDDRCPTKLCAPASSMAIRCFGRGFGGS